MDIYRLIATFTICVSLTSQQSSYCQTVIKSESNGDWASSSSWSLSRPPANGDSIVIQHELTFNSDISLQNCVLNIMPHASLIGSSNDLSLSGSKLLNRGLLFVDDFNSLTNDSLINDGVINIDGNSTISSGVILNSDSIYCDYKFIVNNVILNNWGELVVTNSVDVNQSSKVTNTGSIEHSFLLTLSDSSELTNMGRLLTNWGTKVYEHSSLINETFIYGTITLRSSVFTNNGIVGKEPLQSNTILFIDSASSMENTGVVDVNSFKLNHGSSLVNSKKVICDNYNMFNTSKLTNQGYFQSNHQSIDLFGLVENKSNGIFFFNSVDNRDTLINQGLIFIEGDLENTDLIENHGEMIVKGNFSNQDRINGTGAYNVFGGVSNWSRIEGTLDVCDSLGTSNSPPLLFNSGVIDSSVTFCSYGTYENKVACNFAMSYQEISLCENDSVSINGSYVKTPSLYKDTLLSPTGKDSVVLTNVSLKALNTSTFKIDNQLYSASPRSNYQWVNCSNGYSIIPNATEGTFSPNLGGSYAVIIAQNGCIDTSDCINIVLSDINTHFTNKDIIAYPNPTFGQFFIAPNHLVTEFDVEIVNARGQHVFSKRFNEQSPVEVNFDSEAGIYYVKVHHGKRTQIIKLVIVNK